MNQFKKPICSVLLQYILLPIIAFTSLFANSSPNGNQGQGNGKGHQQVHGNKGKQNKDNSNKGNDNQEIKHVKSSKYYDKHRGANISFNVSFGNVRPLAIEYGLTGYRGLPPGIAKQVSRGKPLPPGIAKKMLPSAFLAELPVYVGYEWKISGRDLILVAIGTAVVAEIIENVFE
ncbi:MULTISPECIES: anti-virulence regulator CigR family protein [Providencia]|uniref:RcnB family protein n=1 Tax=Providencia rettgeri TaxID=587 RepID=A0A3R8W0J1_PRORE|nr:anti-virulence regulator CigR family protein [Providencia rettgeri]ELR5073986.1 hypothetical protein [Providencia stuartii]ELR5068325.1 hypothetical protein [Providencia rettgeri]ELR5217568.1 hypothetical protein [Providencia rettgeri]ELR5220360.1 hypothetical protein [Providencia rettgeri]MBV2190555.1 hypothetical protein [Providencia rettgeri]